MSGTVLLELRVGLFVDLCPDPAGGAGLDQDGFRPRGDSLPGLEAAPGAVEFRLEALDGDPRRFDPCLARVGVLGGHERVPDPDDAVTFRGRDFGFDHLPDVLSAGFAARVGAADGFFPCRLPRANEFAEPLIFLAGARQDGDEAPALRLDVGHDRAGAELGVGDVQEALSAGEFAQGFP